MSTYTASKVIRHYGPNDIDAIYDGEYIGSFKTRQDAQQALDDHAMRLIEDGLVDQPLATLDAPASQYTCLGCGDALPTGRGGHCDACVAWDDLDDSNPDPWPPDALALGRTLLHEAHADRPAQLDAPDAPPPAPPVDDGELDNFGAF